jgi:predicted permease
MLRLRLRALFLRSRVEQELDEELRYHLDRQIEHNIAQGLSAKEAREASLREFDGFEQRKEECRDMRGLNLVNGLNQDLRYALRQLAKNPGFSVTAVLLPALGLCASVAIFAFVDAALLKPLPYPQAARLVAVYESAPECPKCDLSYLDYLDWRRENTVFTALEAYGQNGFIVTKPSGPEPARGAQVSPGFFRVLGVRPQLGRDFREGEERHGTARKVMLSHAAWRAGYGADPGIVGRNVILDDEQYEVIGVLPAEFHFAPAGTPAYWVTLNPGRSCEKRRSCHNLYGVARLKDGASLEAASSQTAAIAKRLEEQYPDSNRGQGARLLPLAEVIAGDARPILTLLIGGAVLLLLIACVNVSSLLLVRAEGRRREMALRNALGASVARLARQLVTEGFALILAGGVLGVATAAWSMQLLAKLIPPPLMTRMPYLEGLGLNIRVLGFALSVAVIAAVLFSVTPMLALPFTSTRRSLAEGGRGSVNRSWRQLGSKLVVAELAIATVLLVCAALLGQSLHHVLRVNLGFNPDRMATIAYYAPDAVFNDAPKQKALARDLLQRVRALPGVASVASIEILPVSYNGNTNWIRFVGKPYNGEHIDVLSRDVSADYFQTVAAKLVRGRFFNESDDETRQRVVIINQTLANRYFPGEDPVGRQIGNTTLSPDSLRTIVGVVADIREGPLDEEIRPAQYFPFNQRPDTYMALVIRTAVPPGTVLPAVASTLRGYGRGVVPIDPAVMWDRIEDSPSAYLRRSAAWLVGGFAAIALVLCVVGLYGVVAYSVGQRTREIGVRMALGAERKSVYRLILGEAGWLIGLGLVVGLAFALGAASLMKKLLFGVQSWDVPTLTLTGLLLALCAMAGSFLPARRAASVNPVDALRSE